MFKVVFAIAAIPLAIVSNGLFAKEETKDVMLQAFNDGKEIVMTKDDVDKVDKLLLEMLAGSKPMPAFGVSLHDETMQAAQEGVWMRFAFDEKKEVDGMAFDQLLVNVRQQSYGFNVVRGNDGKFEGRCFYVDIKQNMDGLFDYLISLPTGEEGFSAQPPERDDNFSSRLIVKAITRGVPERRPNKTPKVADVGAFEIPSVNKDKDKQSTVIEQSASPKEGVPEEDKPGIDQITFDGKQSDQKL